MHSLMISSEVRPRFAVGVLLHLAHDQLLIERAAVDADAHGLAVVAGDRADGGELLVAALAGADVAGIDAVLVERAGAIGILGQQDVAVVVKIADERSFAAGVEHALLDFGDGGGGFRNVHGDADHLRAGGGQLDALLHGGGDVGRVGIGHGLDDDGRAAADGHVADFHAMSLLSMRHRCSTLPRCEGRLYREPNGTLHASRLGEAREVLRSGVVAQDGVLIGSPVWHRKCAPRGYPPPFL